MSMPTVRSSREMGAAQLCSWSRRALSRLVLPCFPSPRRNTRASRAGTPPCNHSSRRYSCTDSHPLRMISSGSSVSNVTSDGSTSCHWEIQVTNQSAPKHIQEDSPKTQNISDISQFQGLVYNSANILPEWMFFGRSEKRIHVYQLKVDAQSQGTLALKSSY